MRGCRVAACSGSSRARSATVRRACIRAELADLRTSRGRCRSSTSRPHLEVVDAVWVRRGPQHVLAGRPRTRLAERLGYPVDRDSKRLRMLAEAPHAQDATKASSLGHVIRLARLACSLSDHRPQATRRGPPCSFDTATARVTRLAVVAADRVQDPPAESSRPRAAVLPSRRGSAGQHRNPVHARRHHAPSITPP